MKAGDDSTEAPPRNALSRFFFPSLTPGYVLRVLGIAACAYIVFSRVLIPLHINGTSMEPTYHDRAWNLCWRFRYRSSLPERGDVVVVRFAGMRVMLLKRVVALSGETVEFRGGKLFVNGEEQVEPYVATPCDWELSPRVVEEGKVYVVGDNRGVPMANHKFGQTSVLRIVGAPLW